MKTTGIIRKVDELGRVVLPSELRLTFDIAPKDALEFYTQGETIVLKKYEPGCTFCGSCDEMTQVKGRNVCRACREELKQAAVKQKK